MCSMLIDSETGCCCDFSIFVFFHGVQRCSIGGLFPLRFFDSKNKLCRYGIWLQTNSLVLRSNWFQNADYRRKSFCLTECSLDAVSRAILPANSCLTVGANAMLSLCIPLWNFDFDTQKPCNASPWITTLKS